jgi:hypothetical protein
VEHVELAAALPKPLRVGPKKHPRACCRDQTQREVLQGRSKRGRERDAGRERDRDRTRKRREIVETEIGQKEEISFVFFALTLSFL